MVTSLYAGILGLIYVLMTVFVVRGRFKYRVSLGNGDSEDLQKRIRMHGNFAEYVPLALLLIFLAELEGTAEMVIHSLGILLIVSRLLFSAGLLGISPIPNSRPAGMVGTLLVLAIAAVFCIKSYFIF